MENRNDSISDAVIRRLPRYYRHLGELLSSGITRVSSGDLSRQMGLTASQVRQDFNHFGGFGQQGYGYNVEMLYREISHILGIDQVHHVIVIGAGHIGQALINYPNFVKRSFHMTAIFDTDPKVIGTKIHDLTVRPVEEIEGFMRENPVDIAVLAVPKAAAREMAEKLVSYGIKGIWNFASTDLTVSDPNVMIENVHLTDSIMQLSYRLHNCMED